MTSYDVVSGDKSTLLVKINSTQTTGIQIAAMTPNGVTTAWGNTAGVLEVTESVEGVTKREWISYTSITTDSSSNATLVGVSRDVSRSASSTTGSGTGQAFNKGADVRFVNFHYIYNQKANIDRANTFSADQTIASGTKVLFGGSGAYVYSSDSGTNLKFKDGSNSETTLTQLAALSGTDTKARASSGDTTSDFLTNKLLVTAPITKTLNNSGSNETLTFALTPPTVAQGGTGVVTTTAYGVLLGGTTSTGAFQNAGAGSSGQFLKSNGAAANPAFSALTATSTIVYASGADSGTLTNPTSATNFDTHNYTIPANDLVAGIVYEVEGTIAWTPNSTYTWTTYLRLGNTSLATIDHTATAGSIRYSTFKGRIFGTAGAGSSVTVNSDIVGASVAVNAPATSNGFATASVATNGTLVLQIAGSFGTSNGGNIAILRNVVIRKLCSTAF